MPNILDRAKNSLERLTPARVNRFLRRPLGYGTVFGILLVTAVMTALFWKAHSPEVIEYSNMSLALTELKLYDLRLDEALYRAQNPGRVDSLDLMVAASVLREIGNHISSTVTDWQIGGLWVPDSLYGALERRLITRLLRAQLLLRERSRFSRVLDSAYQNALDSLALGKKSARTSVEILSWIQQGRDVQPMNAPAHLEGLLETNHRQMVALEDQRRNPLQSVVDEIIAANQTKLSEISSSKEQVNMVFYILSISTVLAVLVLLVRLRR